jgi:NADPH:quinone reductase-like Zn-dependent oxidoreductase
MAALALIPAEMTFDEAAALPCPAGTAFQIYNSLSPLLAHPESEIAPPVVLIRGASGAVGSLVVSLLRLHRVTIIGIGSESRFSEMQGAGVNLCIDYRQGLAAEKQLIQQFLSSRGYSADPNAVALDGIVNLRDSTSAAEDMQLLGHRGILVAVVGRPDIVSTESAKNGDPETAVIPRFRAAPTLVEIALGAAHSFGEVALQRMAFGYKYVAEKMVAGSLPRPKVSLISFDEIPAALELIRLGKASEKFVAVVSP